MNPTLPGDSILQQAKDLLKEMELCIQNAEVQLSEVVSRKVQEAVESAYQRTRQKLADDETRLSKLQADTLERMESQWSDSLGHFQKEREASKSQIQQLEERISKLQRDLTSQNRSISTQSIDPEKTSRKSAQIGPQVESILKRLSEIENLTIQDFPRRLEAIETSLQKLASPSSSPPVDLPRTAEEESFRLKLQQELNLLKRQMQKLSENSSSPTGIPAEDPEWIKRLERLSEGFKGLQDKIKTLEASLDQFLSRKSEKRLQDLSQKLEATTKVLRESELKATSLESKLNALNAEPPAPDKAKLSVLARSAIVLVAGLSLFTAACLFVPTLRNAVQRSLANLGLSMFEISNSQGSRDETQWASLHQEVEALKRQLQQAGDAKSDATVIQSTVTELKQEIELLKRTTSESQGLLSSASTLVDGASSLASADVSSDGLPAMQLDTPSTLLKPQFPVEDLLFLKLRGRLMDLGDQAIALGSRKSYLELLALLNNESEQRFHNAAQVELLRIREAYLNGVHAPVRPLQGEELPEGVENETQIPPAQLRELLLDFSRSDYVRARTAFLLGNDKSFESVDTLLTSAHRDPNLIVVRESMASITRITGWQGELFDDQGVAKWWQEKKSSAPDEVKKEAGIEG